VKLGMTFMPLTAFPSWNFSASCPQQY